jgi:hypothetical protein
MSIRGLWGRRISPSTNKAEFQISKLKCQMNETPSLFLKGRGDFSRLLEREAKASPIQHLVEGEHGI